MAHEDAAPGVDFVVGELVRARAAAAPPPPAGGPRRPRPRLVLLAAAPALAVAVVIVRGTDPAPPRRPSTPTVASSGPSLGAVGAPLAAHGGIRAGRHLLFCPEFTACSVHYELPDAVLQAVRARFPTAVVRSSLTLLAQHDNGPTDVIQRTVVARAGAITITVTIRATGEPTGTPVPSGDRQVTRATSDGHYVTVTADAARGGTLPASDRLDQLVADDRLSAQ